MSDTVRTISPDYLAVAALTMIEPARVNLKALETRLSTIRSHISSQWRRPFPVALNHQLYAGPLAHFSK